MEVLGNNIKDRVGIPTLNHKGGIMELKAKKGESFQEFVVRVLTNLEDFNLSKEEAIKILFDRNLSKDNSRKAIYLAGYIQEAIDSGYYLKFFNATEKNIDKQSSVKYNEKSEILPSGNHKSEKLIELNDEQLKDKNYILKAHGFDPSHWELIGAKNNIWNAYSKVDGIMTLYSSKITAKPIIKEFDLSWFKEAFDKLEPVKSIESKDCTLHVDNNKIVEIQYADLHIGLKGIEYESELKSITDRIIEKNKDASKFLLPIGQDWLNADIKIGANYLTTSGTSLEQSLSYKDMIQTGIRVACYIIDSILYNTKATIDCPYILANHDKHSCFGVFCALMQRYLNNPRIKFDDSMKQRKYIKYGVNGIGLGHGHKEKNKIYKAFSIEAPSIYASTKFREFHLSHLHNESVKDECGVVHRRLPTVNTPDEWHTESGWIGATNRIQTFVYDIDKGLKSIEYYYIEKEDE